MSRVLVVGETSRSIGEFRRPWVRKLHAQYVRGYRRALAGVVGSLGDADVTVLAGRDFVDTTRLHDGVTVRPFDEESYRADSPALSALTHRVIAGWWPARDAEPALTVRGVFLPDLLPIASGILLRLEVMESLSAVEAVLDDVKPDRVVLVTGVSIPERLARGAAADRGVPVAVGGRFPLAALMARFRRALRAREGRLNLHALLRQPRRPPTPAPPGEHFLFSVCQARHLAMVAPMMLACARDGLAASIVAGTVNSDELETQLRRLEGDGASWCYFMDYVGQDEARRVIRALRPTLRRLASRVRAEPACGTDGVGAALAAVTRPFAENAIRWSLPAARLYLEAAFRVLERRRPDAVVIASDRRFAERALALAADCLGVPAMLFWGASVLARDRINRFDVGHRLLVIGEQVRADVVRQGVPAQNVVVVGDPRSNAARLVDRAALRADVARTFGLDPARPLLVMVSKYVSLLFSAEEKETFYATVFAAMKRLQRAQLVVKVHPNENLELLRRQVREWGGADAILTKDYDIHRLFATADVAVMVTSMAGIEAMAMGCPVVAVQTPGKDFEGEYMPPYVSEGVVERVDAGDGAALAIAIARLLADEAARSALVERGRAFAARYLHPVDGALVQRLLDVVDEVRREKLTGGAPVSPAPDVRQERAAGGAP